MRLLLVDDEVEARRALRELLELEGFQVAEAGDGAEALAWLQANPPPAAVVLDLMLPRVSGQEVLTWLAGQETLRDVPVVVVSAGLAPCLEKPQASWLEKPCRFEALLARLSQLGVLVRAGG